MPLMRALAVAVLLVVATRVASAQRVFGNVVGADSTTPVVGAIIVALDSAGNVMDRELTSQRGAFIMPLPRPGHYDLFVLRLGAEPVLVPPVTLGPNEDRRIKVVFSTTVHPLDPVAARGAETCRLAGDPSAEAAKLWVQARIALTIVTMAVDSRTLVGTWHRYEREVDRTMRDTISRKDGTDKNDIDEQAWPTLSPDSAALVGYTLEGEQGITYFAPSIATLLSDEFRDRHCWRLEPAPDGSANLVGLHFRPEHDKVGVNEIEGTWWVDRTTLEPRELTFAYTNMPPSFVAAHPGGYMRFVRATTGEIVMGEWQMRVPAGIFRRLWAYQSGHAASFATRLLLEGARVAGGRLDVLERSGQVVYKRDGAPE